MRKVNIYVLIRAGKKSDVYWYKGLIIRISVTAVKSSFQTQLYSCSDQKSLGIGVGFLQKLSIGEVEIHIAQGKEKHLVGVGNRPMPNI